jgi:hypothetical protein
LNLFNHFIKQYLSTDFLPNLFEVLSFLIQSKDFILNSIHEVDINALVDRFLKNNLISEDFYFFIFIVTFTKFWSKLFTSICISLG